MTDTAIPETTTATLDAYFAMWREPEADARRPLVEQAFTPKGRHVDPLADAHGYDELNEMVSNVHAHYPGFSIGRTSGIDQHGDQLRFGWQVRLPDGSVLVDGIDIGELAPDGRLARVAGFWGDLPAA